MKNWRVSKLLLRVVPPTLYPYVDVIDKTCIETSVINQIYFKGEYNFRKKELRRN